MYLTFIKLILEGSSPINLRKTQAKKSPQKGTWTWFALIDHLLLIFSPLKDPIRVAIASVVLQQSFRPLTHTKTTENRSQTQK